MLQHVLGQGYPTFINNSVFRIRIQVTITKSNNFLVLLAYALNTYVQN